MTPKELLIEAMQLTDAGKHEEFLARQAPDCDWLVPGAGTLRGPDAVREYMQPFWQGFSKSRHELNRFVESGDTVACEGVWKGTNDGPMITPQGELPPTGKSVAMPFVMIVSGDVEAGVAESVHVYFDQLDFLGQLGLVPAPEEAAA
jgi:predicted ester cyclase